MCAFSDLLQQLEGFFGLIGAAIESGDWDGLNGLLVIRQEVLEQLCALPLSVSESEEARALMASIQITDKHFIEVVQSQKEDLQKEASSLTHDRKAIMAYQS